MLLVDFIDQHAADELVVSPAKPQSRAASPSRSNTNTTKSPVKHEKKRPGPKPTKIILDLAAPNPVARDATGWPALKRGADDGKSIRFLQITYAAVSHMLLLI